jgi:hypothetical protein
MRKDYSELVLLVPLFPIFLLVVIPMLLFPLLGFAGLAVIGVLVIACGFGEYIFRVDSVAKVENRTTQIISRKLIFGLLCSASLVNAPTKIRDRFWMKQYGPSHRRA